MALNDKIKVEMPVHCVKVPKNGTTYIQYTKRAYRNDKGKPTSERIAIGKLDPETGMLIPNRNYYELFEKKDPEYTPEFVRSNGVYALISEIVKKCGLKKTLEQVFPENSKEILSVAQYMLTEGNVMYYYRDWLEETVSFSEKDMGGADISCLFASIDEDSRLHFFHTWISQKYKGEYLAYDVTSISSYGKGMESLEWGYNRDKEKLQQINFGMYYGEDSKLPLYYRIYPGSITDKAHLKYMMHDNKLLSCKKAKFVMDRGFYSKENLQYMAQNGYRFVISLPESPNYVKELIKRHRDEIINHSECYLGMGMPYGKAYEVNELGFRMKVHLYYDPAKAVRDSEALYAEIESIEHELQGMKEPPDRKWNYDKYFFINRAKDGSLGYRKNHVAIDEALLRCGMFAIAETDFEKTTAEILELYRKRDVVEKCFDDLKNALDMHRLYVHSDETAQGKSFCAFLALIIRSYMLDHLHDYMIKHKFTFDKVLLELKKSKTISSPKYPRGQKLLNPISKSIRDIFDACCVKSVYYDFWGI